MKLKTIVESFDKEERPSLSAEEKKSILRMISEYNSLGKSLNRENSLPDIAKKLSQMAEAAQTITLSETDDWFDSHTIKRNMNDLKKASSEFNKLAKEAYSHEQRMTALYEDMGHIIGRYFNIKDPIEEIATIGDLEENMGKPKGKCKDYCYSQKDTESPKMNLEEGDDTIFVVSAPSAVHMGQLLLGIGRSREDAIVSAYGRMTRVQKGHYLREMPESEAINIWGEERIYSEL